MINFDDPSFFASLDPFTSTVLGEVMKNLGRGQSAIITPTPMEAGSSSSAKNTFSIRVTGNDDQTPDLAKSLSLLTIPVSWEYLCKSGSQETELETLGNERWELCAICCRADGELWVFKRPKIGKGG